MTEGNKYYVVSIHEYQQNTYMKTSQNIVSTQQLRVEEGWEGAVRQGVMGVTVDVVEEVVD